MPVTNLLARVSAFLLIVPLLLSSCSTGSASQQVLNVGLIFATGGLGDTSFNDSAYSGLLEAQKRLNVRFETANFGEKESNLEALRNFARNDYDLIVGIAFENQDNIATVAAEFPDSRFAIIDVALTGDNIASIVYREQEGDFLMGVLAAMLTKTKVVGIVGGMDIPAIRRIEKGFRQGVSYQDPTVTIISDIAGTFSDPVLGKKLADAQYDRGADVIHNAASRTGLGIIEAAKERDKLTTGTSGDQRYLAPGNMIGNRPKRVDSALLMIIEEVKDGKFSPGIRSLGIKENGLALGPFDETVVNKPMLDRLEELKKKIVSGEIAIEGG
jgi:basic membrane protein A